MSFHLFLKVIIEKRWKILDLNGTYEAGSYCIWYQPNLAGKKNLLLKFAVIEEKHRFFFSIRIRWCVPPQLGQWGQTNPNFRACPSHVVDGQGSAMYGRRRREIRDAEVHFLFIPRRPHGGAHKSPFFVTRRCYFRGPVAPVWPPTSNPTITEAFFLWLVVSSTANWSHARIYGLVPFTPNRENPHVCLSRPFFRF